MSDEYEIRDAAFTPATRGDETRGLLGFLSFRLGEGLRVDGVALRRTSDGRMTLSWPARRDRQGRDHAYIRPIDDVTRRTIEAEILAAIGIEPRPGPGQSGDSPRSRDCAGGPQ